MTHTELKEALLQSFGYPIFQYLNNDNFDAKIQMLLDEIHLRERRSNSE